MKRGAGSNCRRALACAVVAIALLYVSARSVSLASAAEDDARNRVLAELVQKANQEGKLVATVQSSWAHAMLPGLIEGFRKRFGLSIDVSLTPIASARQFPIEIAATRAGAPPTYDVVQGDDAETIQLTGAGGVDKITNWKELLAAVNPDVASASIKPEQVSHGPFEGGSFHYMANVKQIVYNPQLIKPADLPRTHAELGDAKYKGKFTQPPWTSHWEIAPAVFEPNEREKWLDVVRAAGKNGTVLSEVEGVQRVVLGQYPFALAQDAYVRQTLAKDAQAPVASAFFADYNEFNGVYYSVRTRARSPAAATLWALWMTTAEAEALWQPSNRSFQIFGKSSIDVAEREAIKAAGASVIGYLDNDRTIALLAWQQTPDGAKYLAAIAKAIRGE
jgi:ABC-type Fe3+ transport system substrate-binding protein